MELEQIRAIAKEQMEKMDACLQSERMLLTDEDWEIIDTLADMAMDLRGLQRAREKIVRRFLIER